MRDTDFPLGRSRRWGGESSAGQVLASASHTRLSNGELLGLELTSIAGRAVLVGFGIAAVYYRKELLAMWKVFRIIHAAQREEASALTINESSSNLHTLMIYPEDIWGFWVDGDLIVCDNLQEAAIAKKVMGAIAAVCFTDEDLSTIQRYIQDGKEKSEERKRFLRDEGIDPETGQWVN